MSNLSYTNDANKYVVNSKNINMVNKLIASLQAIMISEDSFNKYDMLQNTIKENSEYTGNINNTNNSNTKNIINSNTKNIINSKNTFRDKYSSKQIKQKKQNKYFFTYESNFDVLKYFMDITLSSNVNNIECENNSKLSSDKMNSIINQFNVCSEDETQISHAQTSNFTFQKYKIKICELIKPRSLDIRSLNLNPVEIYDKVLSKNAVVKSGFTHKYDLNYDLDVFFSVLKCLRVSFIYISNRCSFNIYDELNDYNFLIIHDTINTINQNPYLKKIDVIDKEADVNNNESLYGLCNYTIFKLDTCQYNEILNKIKQNTLMLENVKKPIRAMSYYKVDDLRSMSKQLSININISNGKPKTKQQLYSEICIKTASVM